MVNVYNADDILKVKKCGDLFTNNSDTMKKEYRLLVKMWHPDVNKDVSANLVMRHITELYEQGDTLIKKHEWEISNQVIFLTDDNKNITINFQVEKSFELGKYFVCSDKVVYVIDMNQKSYVDNATNIINSFEFADDKMESEMQKFLPKITNYHITKDNKYILVEIAKTSDMLPLSEILTHYMGNIPHSHVAWIISRLNNILCYLQWSGMALNGISLDTCFISPMYHTVVVYGGWWYAKPLGEKLSSVSLDVYTAMPFSAKSKKISCMLTDIECVKSLGKLLLGCKSGYGIEKEAPIPFAKYLSKTNSKTNFENYDEWTKVLMDSYGERKFVKMNVDENELYSC